MSDLPKPSFIDRDPQAVIAEMVAQYEAMTGKTLYPAQVDRLLVDLVSYRESLVRIGIQEAAEQNLVAFARAPMLDYLGELLGVFRLPAQPARTTVRLTFMEPAAVAFQLPVGVRVETTGGIQFQSEKAVDVAIGATSAEFMVAAVESGSAANGYLPGQVSVLVDELPVVVDQVENLTVTRGGMDAEDDERLRARIKLAPEAFSWGSINRYRLAAMTAAADAVDVQVISPRPDGTVQVVVLGRDGAPPVETIERVQAALTDSKARMMNDRIEAIPAQAVDYAISLEVDVLASRVPDLVRQIARDRCLAFAANLSRRLGGDIVPAQIKTALHDIDGLYDVRVLEPAAKRVLSLSEWPRCTGVTVELGRMVDDV